ncbi:DUF4272 domain-containing protein [Bacillus sp. NP157]|nr:DUF4272 domain-containing protein [Bacillus sp. NP157]
MFNRLKSLLRGNAPAAGTEDTPGNGGGLYNVYATTSPLPALAFTHAIAGQRDLDDPALREHLGGFIGYVLSRGDGQMTRTRYHLMRHLQRVRHHVSLRVPDASMDAFAAWAAQANAVVFVEDGSVRDAFGRVLIDGQGAGDDGASVPHPADAWQRKAAGDAWLAGQGIRVPESLPPVIGGDEVRWRSAAEVAGRIAALLVVSTYAESVRENERLDLGMVRERLPMAFDHLSTDELAFLEAAEPDDNAVNQFGWRYESLALLAWAAGIWPTLGGADAICDVATLSGTVLDTVTPEWQRQARLRPAGEILDALDRIYRLHWATREAELGRREPVPGVIPGVVVERHHALNWLVRFEDADWDQVDTPT